MPKATPIAERFKKKYQVVESGCHEWIGSLMPNGYGQIHSGGKTAYAHRVSYEIENGPIPEGMFVLHSCDNRKCVNPDHLSLGSFQENMDDMVAKKRQAHGERNGHAKLTITQVREIRSAIGTHEELAKRFNISRASVSLIRSGKIWRHV